MDHAVQRLNFAFCSLDLTGLTYTVVIYYFIKMSLLAFDFSSIPPLRPKSKKRHPLFAFAFFMRRRVNGGGGRSRAVVKRKESDAKPVFLFLALAIE